MRLTLAHGAWQINQPSNESMWNSYSFQPVGHWMSYSHTDLGAEGCCRSLNVLFALHIIFTYHGYAIRQVTVNSTFLYETNQFSIKGFGCLFSHRSRIYWFLPEETKCVLPTYWSKYKWISEFYRTNPQELKCCSTFYVNYFLRYYLMMQHQPIVKRVKGTHEWAHRPYQPLSAPYHCCLYKHRRLDERQPPQTSWPVPICT